MKKWDMMLRALMVFCVGLVLTACATVETRLPVPSASQLELEATNQETEAFARYLKMRERLDKISAPVLAANAELCTKTRADFGIVTHTKKSYPKHLRDAAARRLAVGDTHTVLLVRRGSAAHKAGIKRGDVLIGDKGKPVSTYDKSLKSADSLHIRRAGKDINVSLNADPACDYAVVLRMSGAVNAYANGRAVIVTTAMMDFAVSDDELALIVGHELAHNTMRHVPKAVWNTIISGLATRTTRPFESEADYVGLYYMARAGYNLDGVEDFWRRLGVQYPKSIVREKTHPVTPRRLLAIRMAVAEVEAKRAAGAELVPNYLPGKEPDYEKEPDYGK
ncbi:MAG: M48 family metallopeptidase [Robiginitomaculum sp.]|nr:M48 family metallopeptidase [Robiginitomaculum sp.]